MTYQGLIPEQMREFGARRVAEVEAATAAWVAWWNTCRLHGACGGVPPAEYEAAYWEKMAP